MSPFNKIVAWLNKIHLFYFYLFISLIKDILTRVLRVPFRQEFNCSKKALSLIEREVTNWVRNSIYQLLLEQRRLLKHFLLQFCAYVVKACRFLLFYILIRILLEIIYNINFCVDLYVCFWCRNFRWEVCIVWKHEYTGCDKSLSQ